VSRTLFKESSNRKIWYNHPQLSGTHEALRNLWKQWIKKAQETDSDYKDYRDREMQLETMYVPSEIAEEFVTEFHKGTTQRHNGATALVIRLGREYIIKNVWKIVRKVIKEYPDYQRNKFSRHKPFGEL